jgi:succinoglycan biosynthesis protein ExoA
MSTEAVRSVLVVIPALNEVARIESVIRRLLEAPPQGVDLRVVVADGGSTDGTVPRVQQLAQIEPRLSLLANPKRIQSAAVNLAVQRHGAQADVLVRCDAHAGYPAGFVASLIETLERTQADAVVVPMDSRGETCFQRAVAWVSNTWIGTGGSAHRGGRKSGFVDHGHHAAFRIASYRRAGGYDETFTHNEDAELDCRQRGLGSRVYLDASIRLDYEPRGTLVGLARQYFAYGRGRARTWQKHPQSLRLRQMALPLHLIAQCAALLAAPWCPALLLLPAAYGVALLTASWVLAFSHRSACGLLAGPAAGVMHTTWALGFLSSLALQREAVWRPDALGALGIKPEEG